MKRSLMSSISKDSTGLLSILYPKAKLYIDNIRCTSYNSRNYLTVGVTVLILFGSMFEIL